MPVLPASCPSFPFKDPNASHLFLDEMTGDWIILAPGRRYRPDGTRQRVSEDPFSPAGLKEQRVKAVLGSESFRITSIENNFPIFHPGKELVGRQEILIEGSKNVPFSTFAYPQICAVLEAMVSRSRALRKDPRLKYIVIFKNEGREAGATQPHAHSQIFGLTFVPERIKQMAKRRNAWRAEIGQTTHALAMHQATADRLIFSDANVVAYAHPDARFPYEVRIVPRRRIDNITQTRPAERRSLAKALECLLPFIRRNKVSYNFFFHDVFGETDEFFEIRFTPRTNVWGGFELDAGIYVNPVPAECAAGEYREAFLATRKRGKKSRKN